MRRRVETAAALTFAIALEIPLIFAPWFRRGGWRETCSLFALVAWYLVALAAIPWALDALTEPPPPIQVNPMYWLS